MAATLSGVGLAASINVDGVQVLTTLLPKRLLSWLPAVLENVHVCQATPFGGGGPAPPPGHYSDFIEYTSIIGRPYDAGRGCDGIYNAVSTAVHGLQGSQPQWACSSYGSVDGNNTLIFVVALPQYESALNAALAVQYPAVEGGFNCCANC
ncbi:hypothetical protein LTR85_003433 [Meristemomyces frigidus]|nr:hypothetical protein LTR85_003433 [Meristemomyces frigidus]